MRAQTFERHPLDSHVLLSQNIEDINYLHPADPDHFKAGFIRGLVDDDIKNDLLSIPSDAKFLNRKITPFNRPEDAHDLLKKHLSSKTLNLIAAINVQFSAAANGQETSLRFMRNLGFLFPASMNLHFEGGTRNGPSMIRDFRGNLSVSKDDRPQMIWIPTDNLSKEEIRAIAHSKNQSAGAYPVESAASGDLSVLHGLSYAHPDLHKHGLLHAGPQRHERMTVLWGIAHPH